MGRLGAIAAIFGIIAAVFSITGFSFKELFSKKLDQQQVNVVGLLVKDIRSARSPISYDQACVWDFKAGCAAYSFVRLSMAEVARHGLGSPNRYVFMSDKNVEILTFTRYADDPYLPSVIRNEVVKFDNNVYSNRDSPCGTYMSHSVAAQRHDPFILLGRIDDDHEMFRKPCAHAFESRDDFVSDSRALVSAIKSWINENGLQGTIDIE